MHVVTSLQPLDQAARIMIDAGDGMHLWFDDRRVGTRRDDRDVAVRLTGADVVHELVAVRVRGRLGSLDLDERLEPEPNQFFRATWDGTEAIAGRAHVADLEIGWELAGTFPRPTRTRWWDRRVVCGSIDVRSQGCGGFVPASVHRLDTDADLLWRGDGSQLAQATANRAAGLAALQVGANEIAVPDGDLIHVFGASGLLEGTLQARKSRVIATAQHDDAGRLISYSTHGHEFALEHRFADDGSGGEVLVESPAEVWLGIELDDEGRAITVLNHERRELSLTYGELGCVERIDHPNGLVTEIERDEVGRVISMSDSTGRSQHIDRREDGDIAVTTGEHRTVVHGRRIDADGTVITTHTDGAGHQTVTQLLDGTAKTTRPNGTVTTTTRVVRSARQAPITIEQTLIEAPSGRTLQRTRESAHDAERLTIGNRVWIMRFDSKTQTLTAVRPDELTATATHAPGTALVLATPGRTDLEIRFDAHRRPKRQRRNGVETIFGYDQYGRVGWAELDRVRLKLRHDERGRVIGVKSPDGWLHFRRDDEGWISEIENCAKGITSIVRGLDGRIEQLHFPGSEHDRSGWIYGHDADGLEISKQAFRGSEWMPPIEYGRDSAGRISSITTNDRKLLARHDDSHGELTELSIDDGETLTWSWDGDMCWATDVRGVTPARVERVFDDEHRIAVRTVNRAATVNYHRDESGWLRSVGPLVIERNRSARDVVGWRLGALSTSMQRDNQGRVISQETRLGKLAAVFFAEEIERDEFGRIVSVLEHSQGADRTLTYDYDDAGRLTEATVNGESVLTIAWDANGNAIRIVRQGRALAMTVDAQDRLVSVADQAVAYDPAGNLISIGDGQVRQLDWNGFGQLISATNSRGVTTGFRLDALGRPVQIGEAPRTRLVWDGNRVAATLAENDDIDIRFLDTREHGTAPQALVRDGHEYLLIRDHLGSVRAVVEALTGKVVQALTFDPLGRCLGDTNPGWQPFGFAGGITDPASGLVRFGQRVYDPFVGRYLSPDPDMAGLVNRYQFAGGDPVNGYEPTGTIEAEPGLALSSHLGELSVATDPYLFDRPTTIDRSWLASPALRQGVGGPSAPDPLMTLMDQWSTERSAAEPRFDRSWDPLDACYGRGGFEYQPSPGSAPPGRLARLRDLAQNPPSASEIGEQIKRDLARLIEGLPD